jgi:hypothetical protein
MKKIEKAICLILRHRGFKCNLRYFKIKPRAERLPWGVVTRCVLFCWAAAGEFSEAVYSRRELAVGMVFDLNIIELTGLIVNMFGLVATIVSIVEVRNCVVHWGVLSRW